MNWLALYIFCSLFTVVLVNHLDCEEGATGRLAYDLKDCIMVSVGLAILWPLAAIGALIYFWPTKDI